MGDIILSGSGPGGGGGGGGPVTIADGADVTLGAIADLELQGDNPGTISAKLRGINTILDTWNSGGSATSTIRVTVPGVVQIAPASDNIAVGGQAADGDVLGNGALPIIIAGAHHTLQPTYADGTIVEPQFTSRGSLIIATGAVDQLFVSNGGLDNLDIPLSTVTNGTSLNDLNSSLSLINNNIVLLNSNVLSNISLAAGAHHIGSVSLDTGITFAAPQHVILDSTLYADRGTFTIGSSGVPMMGVYDDTLAGLLTGTQAVPRMTQTRELNVMPHTRDVNGNSKEMQSGSSSDLLTYLGVKGNASGTLNGAGQVALSTTLNDNSALGVITITIAGTWAGTIQFEDTNSNPYTVIDTATGLFVTTTTSNSVFILPINGRQNWRIRMTAYTSGTANVSSVGIPLSAAVALSAPLPAGLNTIGGVTVASLPLPSNAAQESNGNLAAINSGLGALFANDRLSNLLLYKQFLVASTPAQGFIPVPDVPSFLIGI